MKLKVLLFGRSNLQDVTLFRSTSGPQGWHTTDGCMNSPWTRRPSAAALLHCLRVQLWCESVGLRLHTWLPPSCALSRSLSFKTPYIPQVLSLSAWVDKLEPNNVYVCTVITLCFYLLKASSLCVWVQLYLLVILFYPGNQYNICFQPPILGTNDKSLNQC